MDLLNTRHLSVPLTGNLMRYLHSVSIVHTGIGLPLEYYIDATGGFLTPCFVDDGNFTARSTGNPSSDAFLKAWRHSSLRKFGRKFRPQEIRRGKATPTQ
jgi:hypothetical protein